MIPWDGVGVGVGDGAGGAVPAAKETVFCLHFWSGLVVAETLDFFARLLTEEVAETEVEEKAEEERKRWDEEERMKKESEAEDEVKPVVVDVPSDPADHKDFNLQDLANARQDSETHMYRLPGAVPFGEDINNTK